MSERGATMRKTVRMGWKILNTVGDEEPGKPRES